MPDIALAPGPNVAGKRIPVPAVKPHRSPAAKTRHSVQRAAKTAEHAAKHGAETGRAAVSFARNVAPRQRVTRAQAIRSRAVHRAPAVTAAIAASVGLEYLLDPTDSSRRRRALSDHTIAARRRFAGGRDEHTSRLARSALERLLQLVGPRVDEHPAEHVDERAANHHPEHPAEIDVERVGRSGAPIAEVLELPAAVDRLEVALLLSPASGGVGPL